MTSVAVQETTNSVSISGTSVTVSVSDSQGATVTSVGVQGPQGETGPAGAGGGLANTNTFTATAAQTDFSISSAAETLVGVFINQINYVNFCAITPAGSGNVVYTAPSGGYVLEAGDNVYIEWV